MRREKIEMHMTSVWKQYMFGKMCQQASGTMEKLRVLNSKMQAKEAKHIQGSVILTAVKKYYKDGRFPQYFSTETTKR